MFVGRLVGGIAVSDGVGEVAAVGSTVVALVAMTASVAASVGDTVSSAAVAVSCCRAPVDGAVAVPSVPCWVVLLLIAFIMTTEPPISSANATAATSPKIRVRRLNRFDGCIGSVPAGVSAVTGSIAAGMATLTPFLVTAPR